MGCLVIRAKPLNRPILLTAERKGDALLAVARRIGEGLKTDVHLVGLPLRFKSSRVSAGLSVTASMICTISIDRSVLHAVDGIFYATDGPFFILPG